jgi:NADH-quinone oxidoreductase subunit M
VVFGTVTNPQLATITDMDRREILFFLPLIIGTLLLGFAPGLVTDVTAASVDALVADFTAATGGRVDGPRY